MLPLFIFLIKGKEFIFYVFFDIAVMTDILNKINSINLQIVVGFIVLPIGTRYSAIGFPFIPIVTTFSKC